MSPGRVPPDVVKAVHQLYGEEKTYRKVADILGKQKNWVHHIITTYCGITGELTKPYKAIGRPRKIKGDEASKIVEYFAAKQDISMVKASRDLGIHKRSLQRVVRELGLRTPRPISDEPHPLNASHRQERLRWTLAKQAQLASNTALFNRTIFSDEAHYRIVDGKVVTWALGKEKRDPDDPPLDDDGGVMVWGAISLSGPVCIQILPHRMTSAMYRQILSDRLLPYMDVQGRDMDFQQKSRTAHTSGVMKRFFHDEGINVIPWPRNSADLNPIHDVWELVSSELALRSPKDLDDLRQMIPVAWEKICTPELCRKLYASIFVRIDIVVNKNGAFKFKRPADLNNLAACIE